MQYTKPYIKTTAFTHCSSTKNGSLNTLYNLFAFFGPKPATDDNCSSVAFTIFFRLPKCCRSVVASVLLIDLIPVRAETT